LTEEEWAREIEFKSNSNFPFKYRHKAYKDELIKETIKRLIEDETLVEVDQAGSEKYSILGSLDVDQFMERFWKVARPLAQEIRERQAEEGKAASEKEKKERECEAAKLGAIIEGEKKRIREKK
jgi:hypothetical protein